MADVVVVGSLNIEEASPKLLASYMVGRQLEFNQSKRPCKSGATVLQVKDLRCDNDKNIEALHGVSFDLVKGEILGVAGVSGNGQREIAEVIAVGPGGLVDGKEVQMYVKAGDRVITSKYSGTEVKLDKEEYTIVRQNDILAVVE